MKTINDFLNTEFDEFLRNNKLTLKKVGNDHYAIYNSNYCIKLYDRLGHGFSTTVNIARTYNELMYEDDTCNMHWAMKYFELAVSSDFSSRKLQDYESNLPLLMNDLKKLIERLNSSYTIFWSKGIEWIDGQVQKRQ